MLSIIRKRFMFPTYERDVMPRLFLIRTCSSAAHHRDERQLQFFVTACSQKFSDFGFVHLLQRSAVSVAPGRSRELVSWCRVRVRPTGHLRHKRHWAVCCYATQSMQCVCHRWYCLTGRVWDCLLSRRLGRGNFSSSSSGARARLSRSDLTCIRANDRKRVQRWFLTSTRMSVDRTSRWSWPLFPSTSCWPVAMLPARVSTGTCTWGQREECCSNDEIDLPLCATLLGLEKSWKTEQVRYDCFCRHYLVDRTNNKSTLLKIQYWSKTSQHLQMKIFLKTLCSKWRRQDDSEGSEDTYPHCDTVCRGQDLSSKRKVSMLHIKSHSAKQIEWVPCLFSVVGSCITKKKSIRVAADTTLGSKTTWCIYMRQVAYAIKRGSKGKCYSSLKSRNDYLRRTFLS